MGQLSSFDVDRAIVSQNPRPINNKPRVIAIIPAYNESKNIGRITSIASKYVSLVVVVDDGSDDNTVKAINSANIVVLRNRNNMGKGAALKRGLVECLKYNPDIVVTLDADGQHDPEEIPKLIDPICQEDADIVVGSRYNHLSEIPPVRKFGLLFINRINKSLVKNVADSQSGFRAYSKTVLGIILNYDSKGFGAEIEQLAGAELAGFRIAEVSVKIKYRGLEKTSKKNALFHGAHLLTTIFRIATERKPLIFFGLTGLVLTMAAIIPASNMMQIFNKSRYFSIPLAIISLGLFFIGVLMILLSFVLYSLKRIRDRMDANLNLMSNLKS
jgi:glycosyltransferase involved in cell wall biosynthesis